ncbi:MAG: diaminopimelate dehydrogenase [Oscillospiraceae bacterium]|nr:diaminopimelate dehydrogenase [Oscillospiraceae bacterium]
MPMKIGLYGYGNLARGVEAAIAKNSDLTLNAVFSRRDPQSVKIATAGVPVVRAADVWDWQEKLDVLVICGGSATDLPEMTPMLAKAFNVVDSYDNHSNIPTHFANVDAAAKKAGTTALISCGWDPGMFSLARLYANCILPDGSDYTFWGRGVSQGHSDAIRRIEGVLDARQYTVPSEEAMARVRSGEKPVLTTREKHRRECYVVAADGADREAIRKQIVEMPAYFADYDTTVEFITMDEMKRNHSELPHGGSVIRTGTTDAGTHQHVIEYALKLDSNPEFTGSVLASFARAVYRMAQRGEHGCKTVFDVAPKDLALLPREELIAHML